MENINKSPFTFNDFHVTDFSIKRQPISGGDLEWSFNPSGYVDKNKRTFMMDIDFKIKDSKMSFDIECKCIALFGYGEQHDESPELDTFFYINAPAIVFPYIRSYIASVTALSGLSAISIPLFHFPKVIGHQLRENTKEIGNGSEGD